MSDYPDIYADGFSLSGGNYGLTLTFTLSQPTGEPGPHEEPTTAVVRVRVGRELAQTLKNTLEQILVASVQQPSVTTTTKH
jgi:hypothetical protein